jgi:hypothetical protein
VAEPDNNWDSLWDRPWPYGLPSAIEAGATIATPLFAGFSLTLAGLVLTNGGGVRWPGIALSLLTASTVVFLMALQFGVWARSFSASPQEIKDWRPDASEDLQQAIQRLHLNGYRVWASRFHHAYRIGLLLLLLGFATALVPRHAIHAFRGLAVGVAVAGCVAELLWIAASFALRKSPDWEIVDGTVSRAENTFPQRAARKLLPVIRVKLPPPPPVPAPPSEAVE